MGRDGNGDMLREKQRGPCPTSIRTWISSEPVQAHKITYLDETAWSQDRLLIGKNGIAALTFCNVPVLDERKTE